MMFGLHVHRPEYNNIIGPFIALEPISYVKHIKSPIRLLASTSPFVNQIDVPLLVATWMMIMCGTRFIRDKLRSSIVCILCGMNRHELNMDRSTAFLAHVPSGTNIKI